MTHPDASLRPSPRIPMGDLNGPRMNVWHRLRTHTWCRRHRRAHRRDQGCLACLNARFDRLVNELRVEIGLD